VTCKSRIFFPLFLFFLGSALLGKASPDDQISTIMNSIRQRYGEALGLNAEYTREAISKTMVALGVTERHDVAQGRLFFKPPHSIRLEQASPQEELLLTDGETLWWYLPEKREAYKYAADKFGKELRLLVEVLRGLKGSKDHFLIDLTQNPETKTHQLILRPEPPWQDIDHLEVVLRQGDLVISQVTIFNSIGGLTRFLLSDWQENVPLYEGSFTFSPPPGTKVIEK
jgi:outer membrane lipoprotein carrier protein